MPLLFFLERIRKLIGFNGIGNKGWLGNQMFQYAALRGIASNNGYEFCIPPDDGTRQHNYGLFKVFEMSGCSNVRYIYAHTTIVNFGFDEIFFNQCPDNINIDGFFQTEKYFINIKEEIINDFKFKKQFEKVTEDYVSLHVRRGDYLNYPGHHPVCDLNYYQNALSIFENKYPVVVFSDDIEWCKHNISADYYSEDTSAERDLYLMTNATHNIIANSSFSWWGAWLNKNKDKTVVAPTRWFGDQLSIHNTSDIIPNEWITI